MPICLKLHILALSFSEIPIKRQIIYLIFIIIFYLKKQLPHYRRWPQPQKFSDLWTPVTPLNLFFFFFPIHTIVGFMSISRLFFPPLIIVSDGMEITR